MSPAEVSPSAPHQAPLVLVVDDDQTCRWVACRYLEACGCRTSEAASGAGAVDACARHGFDLILMDMSLPGVDGIEATRRIRLRQAPGMPRPAILAVSGHDLAGSTVELAQVGVDGFLRKPLDRDELGSAIRLWCLPPQRRSLPS